MKFRPLMGEALVYVDAAPSESAGGIALLGQAPEDNNPEAVTYGQVRSLGIWKVSKSGRMLAYDVKLGDRVAFNSGIGRWLRSNQERLKLVPADSILAVVEKEIC